MPGTFYGRYTASRKGTKRKTKKESDAFMRRSKALADKKKMNRLIKRQLEDKAEKKQTSRNPKAYAFSVDNSAMSPAISLTDDFMQITAGIEDGRRIGEEIRTTRAMLNIITVAPPDGTSILLLFIGKYKRTPTTIPTAVQLARIFDDGEDTAAANGTYDTLIRKVNYDEFTINTYRQYKLGQSNNADFTNNDFSAYRKIRIDLSKQLGGVVKFGDNEALASVTPTNKHLYMWATWVNPRTGATSTNKPTMHYYLDYQYIDN